MRQTIVCRRVDDRVSGRTSGGGGGGGVPLAAPSHGAERAHAHRGCFRRPPPVATQGRHLPPRPSRGPRPHARRRRRVAEGALL